MKKYSKNNNIFNVPTEIKILMSDDILELLPALAKVKGEIKAVSKKQDNPFFKSTYADLNEHLEVVEPVLEKHGLLLLQPINASNNANYVISTIFHTKSGQYISSSVMIPQLTDAQKVLAAITYFRRGGLNSLLALRSVDDDGESIVGRNNKPTKNKNKRTTKWKDEDL